MQDAITLNLPSTPWAYAIIVAYCVALLLTYPLMLFPAVRITEQAATGTLGLKSGSELARTWKRNSFRTLFVATTITVAWASSTQLNNLVSLVGAFSCTPLAFIFPALFHLRLVGGSWPTRASNVVIIVLGIGVFFFSTYQTIAGWGESVVNPCPYSS